MDMQDVYAEQRHEALALDDGYDDDAPEWADVVEDDDEREERERDGEEGSA